MRLNLKCSTWIVDNRYEVIIAIVSDSLKCIKKAASKGR